MAPINNLEATTSDFIIQVVTKHKGRPVLPNRSFFAEKTMPKNSQMINSKQTPQTQIVQQATQIVEEENDEDFEELTQVKNKQGRKPDKEEVKAAKKAKADELKNSKIL